MLFGSKTIFDRACGAGSKISFSDLLLNAPNMQNKPFFFQVAKNHSEAEFCQPWASEACLNANLPPPPPPPPHFTKSFYAFCVQFSYSNSNKRMEINL